MLRVFISYTREDQDVVNALLQDIEALGHRPWFDQQLTGGRIWWNQVLTEIRECDVLVFALSPVSLDSHACKLEYTYAFSLHKSILPILVADGVSMGLVPTALSQIQFIDYRNQDKQTVFDLINAIAGLAPSQPLPDPLPQPPEVPLSYLAKLRDQVETTATLGFEKQAALLVQLKDRLNKIDEFNDVRNLLERFRLRDDLLAKVAEELDVLLTDTKDVPSDQNRTPSASRVSTTLANSETSESTSHDTDSKTKGTIPDVKTVHIGPMKVIVTVKGHLIEMHDTGWGPETVKYDGEVVSRKVSFGGATHAFQVHEDGEYVLYEVKMTSRIGTKFEAKRNGEIFFSNH